MDLIATVAEMEAMLSRLLVEREAATGKRERKQLSGRIKSARTVIQWAKSRRGYVVPEKNPRPIGETGARA